jgi:putative SOS response-associated peptidase YedK
LIEPIHDWMPVILDERTAEDWMNRNETEPSRLKGFLAPAPGEKLVITLASPLVNSVTNDGPELLDAQVALGRRL